MARLVEWHPYLVRQFAGYSNGKLDLFEINSESGQHDILKSYEIPSASCMEWRPTQQHMHIALGTQLGAVSILDWSTNSESVVNKSAKTARNRPCIGVSWNKHNSNLLAAGFELLKGEHCVVVWDVDGRATNSIPGVDEDDKTIVTKLCFEEATASLCWLPQDPQLLAVGTSMGWVRIYDTRIRGGVISAEISLMAHPAARPRKVKGIRPDPFNPHLLATFSDSAGEVVKVWDLRKGTAAKSKLTPSYTVIPYGTETEGQVNLQSAVADVAWSTARPNVLAVITTHNRNVSFYSTAIKAPLDAATRVPFHSISASETVKALSWQNIDKARRQLEPLAGSHEGVQQIPKQATSSLNRLLIATSSGYGDLEIKESVPLGLASGRRIAFGLSQNIYVSSASLKDSRENPTISSEELASEPWYQGEKTMSERSSAGYSLDAGKNMQVLFDELDTLLAKGSTADMPTPMLLKVNSLFELSRVWGWIDRVGSIHDEDINLADCGVLCMFVDQQQAREGSENGTQHYIHEVLGTKIYSSECRTSARKVCGWTDIWNPSLEGKGLLRRDQPQKSSQREKDSKDTVNSDGRGADSNGSEDSSDSYDEISELDAIVEECEDLDSFERAAAIALWHGNIGLAVRVLQRNIEAGATVGDHTVDEATYKDSLTAEYLQLMSLVAMCFAGYNGNYKSSVSNIWAPMCLHVLGQLEGSKRHATSYLIAACRFLLDIVDDSATPFGAYDNVILDDKIYLEDRIALACTVLPDCECLKWLSDLCLQCKESGRLEGLLVAGLAGDGLEILQQYVDTHGDIQTAALLVGRTVEKIPENGSPTREWLWLYEYRNLLNRWQMFIERASLDVELGKLQRQRPLRNRSSSGLSLQNTDTLAPDSSVDKARPNPAAAASGMQRGVGSASGPGKARAGALVDKKTSLNRVMYALPAHSDFPHVYLRCNYCSSSLPVDAMQQLQHTAFLRKQRPIINFCPNCKKPLPRCYVCQLYVGLINPHAEVSRILAQKRRLANNFNPVVAAAAAPSSGQGSNSNVAKEDEKADHNILDFGRWLFFCQRCKHGGHASCINDWFEGEGGTTARVVCGVNGCSCLCTLH